MLNILSGVALGLLPINIIQPLGFYELVDLSTGNPKEELFGELVRDWFSCGVMLVAIPYLQIRTMGNATDPQLSVCLQRP